MKRDHREVQKGFRVRGQFLIQIHDNPTTQFIGSSSFTYIHHYRYASFCSQIFIVYLVLFITVLLSFFFFLSIFSHVRHPTHQHLNPTHTVCIDHHNITSKVYLSILTYFILLSFLYKQTYLPFLIPSPDKFNLNFILSASIAKPECMFLFYILIILHVFYPSFFCQSSRTAQGDPFLKSHRIDSVLNKHLRFAFNILCYEDFNYLRLNCIQFRLHTNRLGETPKYFSGRRFSVPAIVIVNPH